MRNQAAPLLAGTFFLLIGIIILATPVQAIGGFDTINFNVITDFLSKVLLQITNLLAIQSVRVVIALIAIFTIFYNLLDSVMGKISQLSESRKPIAIAISLLAVLAIFKTLSMDKLDKLMITFAIAMILIFLFKWLMKLKNYFGQKFNPRKAQKDQKKLKSNQKDSKKFDNVLQKDLHNINHDVHTENSDVLDIEKELKRILNKSEDGKKLIKKIYGDNNK